MKTPELKLATVAAILALGLGLAGCGSSSGSGGSTSDDMTQTDPSPTAYEAATAAIAAAGTAADAQAAYDAVKADVTATQGEMLQMKVDERIAAIQMAARVADQRMALMGAAGMIDTSDLSTAEAIADATNAINMLQAALDAAADVSDADKAMYRTQLDNAKDAVAMAQTGLDTEGRMTAQRMNITDAVAAARTAVGMVDDDATDAEVMAADEAIAALKAAIDSADDLPEGDTDVASARGTLETLEGRLAAVRTSRTAAMDAADTAADRARVARAARLYEGITRNSAPSTSYSTDAGTMGDIKVRFDVNGDGFNGGDPAADDGFGDESEDAFLSEDKDAEVAGLHGWTGRRYTTSKPIVIAGASLPGTYEGTYEAMVWSHVEAPKEGEKFSTQYSTVFASGTLDEATTESTAGRVASPSFDHTAGLKRFKLPDPNPQGQTIITIAGSYHGVAGTYSCTPGAGSTCAASFAGPGFDLGGVDAAGFAAGKAAWTFKPADANARVMSAEDTVYPSYGWWLHTAESGKLTASAFELIRNTDGANFAARNAENSALRARISTTLYGTATYVGGAVGQYALSSATGGTNDAGAFTARATLKAAFNGTTGSSITGTIDAFTGAGGEDRDWEVELKKADILSYFITSSSDVTVWTIGDTAADASGSWAGTFYEAGDDGVPQVATGTFRTEYGTEGIMIGAFGTNKQE